MAGEAGLCCVCHVRGRKRAVSCGLCEGYYHLTCAGLTRAQAAVIARWLCPACLGVAGTVIAPALPDIDLEEYIKKCRHVRVLRIIPKGAVISVAEALHKLIDLAIQEKSSISWGRLLSFCYWGLRRPAAGDGGSRGVSLTTLVKRQVVEFMEATELAEPQYDTPQRKAPVRERDLGLKKGVAGKLADGDVKGAVRLLASAEGHAPQDDRTLGLLREKHPPAPENLSLPDEPNDDCPSPTVSEEDVKKALASFRPGSAGGPDGLRPGHLLALTSQKAAEAGVRLLASLTRLVNFVLGGEVPEFAVSVFYGASLCALGKKDGGVRPIAVGNTFRRLATKVGAKPLSSGLGRTLRPVQLGFSTRCGCEAAAHAARRYLGEASHRRVIFKVDMANAFNCLRRDVFLAAARRRVPGLFRLLWQAYSGPRTLFYGDTSLVSATGIQQGDPFGPALFSLGIDDLTRRIDTEFNVWYLDDGTIGDSPDKVLACVRRLIDDLREVGLEVNQSKCELVILGHTDEDSSQTEVAFRELLPRLKVISESDVSLLGAPLSEEGLAAAIEGKREDLERLVSRLAMIENHQAFVLLKNCLSLPKLQYILRASPAYLREEHLRMFDESLVAALQTVTNVRLEGDSLGQSVLPVALGGLGIRMSKDVALPAFISSLHSVGSLVDELVANIQLADSTDLQSAVGSWEERCAGLALAADADRSRQRTWDGPLVQASFDGLLERADQISRARLLAASSRESGLWLHALPVPSLGTLLDPESFRVAVALRVGAEVCVPHSCRCGREMDARGLHGLSCRFSAGRHPRHAVLNDVIRRALQSAGIPSVLEPVGIDRGDGKRPDGLTVFPYSNGKCLCWDATCVDTYAVTHLNNSAVSPGKAAGAAEVTKRRKYAELGVRYRFEPVAVETSGVFGDSTGPVISELGRRVTEVTGDRRETFWLEQRIGLAIQRGNAHSILAAVREKYDAR